MAAQASQAMPLWKPGAGITPAIRHAVGPCTVDD